MKNLVICLLLFFSINTNGQNYFNKISNKQEFDKFSGLPLVEKYGEVSSIKLVYDLKNKNIVDIITQSSLNNNKLVMTETEIQKLANQLEIIKKYFVNNNYTNKWYLDFGLDIEFKLDEKNRELYIKQVRHYND